MEGNKGKNPHGILYCTPVYTHLLLRIIRLCVCVPRVLHTHAYPLKSPLLICMLIAGWVRVFLAFREGPFHSFSRGKRAETNLRIFASSSSSSSTSSQQHRHQPMWRGLISTEAEDGPASTSRKWIECAFRPTDRPTTKTGGFSGADNCTLTHTHTYLLTHGWGL